MSGRSRRHSRVAARRVSGRITRTPSSSPPRQRISANLDSSSAVDTVFDDGTTLVRKRSLLENGMICCIDPPSAVFIAAAIGAAPSSSQAMIDEQMQATLESSYSSAAEVAKRYPQYSDVIISEAKTAFLKGQAWAFGAASIAVVLAAVVVFFCFPKREQEIADLARYAAEDGSPAAGL